MTPAAFTRQTGEAHWHVLIRARAIENGAFMICAAQGGTHERGFASGVVEALRDAGAAGFVEEDALEGLFAVVSTRDLARATQAA